jgi:hypothetical protein
MVGLSQVVRLRSPSIFWVGSFLPLRHFSIFSRQLYFRLFLSSFTLTDQDTAEYLANTLPVDWFSEHVVSAPKILSTLRQIHMKNPKMVFEERVKEALITLGVSPPPTPP